MLNFPMVAQPPYYIWILHNVVYTIIAVYNTATLKVFVVIIVTVIMYTVVLRKAYTICYVLII